jgi:hypothetical protein
MDELFLVELARIHRSLDAIENYQRVLLRLRGVKPARPVPWTPWRERLHAAVRRREKAAR